MDISNNFTLDPQAVGLKDVSADARTFGNQASQRGLFFLVEHVDPRKLRKKQALSRVITLPLVLP